MNSETGNIRSVAGAVQVAFAEEKAGKQLQVPSVADPDPSPDPSPDPGSWILCCFDPRIRDPG